MFLYTSDIDTVRPGDYTTSQQQCSAEQSQDIIYRLLAMGYRQSYYSMTTSRSAANKFWLVFIMQEVAGKVPLCVWMDGGGGGGDRVLLLIELH